MSASSKFSAKRARSNSVAKKSKKFSSPFSAPGMSLIERKNVDVNSSASPGAGVATWTTPVLLNPLSQGDSSTTRDGRQVVNKSLFIRWHAALNTTSIGGSSIRILVVYDSQTNAAAPLITDMLQTDNFLSPNNLGNSRRFRVIVDELTPPISVGGPYAVDGVIYRKLDNMVTMFGSGNAGTVADINSGSFYMLFSQGADIATAAPTIDYYTRIRFTDA